MSDFWINHSSQSKSDYKNCMKNFIQVKNDVSKIHYFIFFELALFLYFMHVGHFFFVLALLCCFLTPSHRNVQGVSRDLIIELFLSVMSRGIGMHEGNRWPLKLVTSASLCVWLPHCAVTSRPNLRRAPLCWATASHLCDTFCLNITFLKVHLCMG